MISSSTAAGLIAGMTQATQGLRQQWESLSERQQSELIEGWRRAIEERPHDAPEVIIDAIAHHPSLAAAWQRLGSYLHDSRLSYIQAIVRDASATDGAT